MSWSTHSEAPTPGVWVWLFPLSQCAHAAEEYWEGYGFHRWLSDLTYTPFSAQHVLMMHLGFVLVMGAATVLAVRLPFWGWVVPGLAVLVLVNALAHVFVWVVSASSSSGLVSSVVLWFPLGVIGLVRSWRGLGGLQFWGGVLAGAVTQVPVSWVALRAGRF